MGGEGRSGRRRERGQFPGAHRRDDITGTWEIPVEDLIAAGLWRPVEGDEHQPDAALSRSKVERRLEETRLQLERSEVRIEALTAALADRRDEIAYLRRALDAVLLGSSTVTPASVKASTATARCWVSSRSWRRRLATWANCPGFSLATTVSVFTACRSSPNSATTAACSRSSA